MTLLRLPGIKQLSNKLNKMKRNKESKKEQSLDHDTYSVNSNDYPKYIFDNTFYVENPVPERRPYSRFDVPPAYEDLFYHQDNSKAAIYPKDYPLYVMYNAYNLEAPLPSHKNSCLRHSSTETLPTYNDALLSPYYFNGSRSRNQSCSSSSTDVSLYSSKHVTFSSVALEESIYNSQPPSYSQHRLKNINTMPGGCCY